ncbi:mRNA-decapping enzyme subunit 2 [Chamberlinius hualienensis]
MKRGGLQRSVFGCSNSYAKLTKFPNNEELKLQWIAAILIKDYKPGNDAKVFSLHFSDGRPTLDNPSPTLDLGHDKKFKPTRRKITRKSSLAKPKGKQQNKAKQRKLDESYPMEHKHSQDLQAYLNGIIPKDILDDLSRLCFQIELAHWFYLDFYCPENAFLRQCPMRDFAKIIFNHIPSIKEHSDNVDYILAQWREYKMAVPTYGAIMFDQAMENVLLVQSYFAKASWGFPKGKVNEGEEPHRCAVREVFEETGFNIEKLINPNEYLEHHIGSQLIRLYLVTDVPRDYDFKPKTRNEIKGFKWFPVCSLPSTRKDMTCKQSTGFGPNAFFMVIPFVRNVRKWIAGKLHKPRRQRSKTTSDVQMENETAEKLMIQHKLHTTALQKSYAGFFNENTKSLKVSQSPSPWLSSKSRANKPEHKNYIQTASNTNLPISKILRNSNYFVHSLINLFYSS